MNKLGRLNIYFSFFFLLTFPLWLSAQRIPMTSTGGVYTIPCEVNGLKLNPILDTGASNVSISLTEALFMLRNGYLSSNDVLGTEYYRIANGDIVEGTGIILRKVKIGDQYVYNVKASVTHTLDAPLLLGQSVLNKLGKFTVDYSSKTLIIGSGSSSYTNNSQRASNNSYRNNNYSYSSGTANMSDAEEVAYYEQKLTDPSIENSRKFAYALNAANIAYSKLGQKIKGRSLARKAAKYNPYSGKPYLVIGKMYAGSGTICSNGVGTGFDAQQVVWAAIDQWKRAIYTEPGSETARAAQDLINRYTQYMPSREDCLRKGLQEGIHYTVGCWINEPTKVRFY